MEYSDDRKNRKPNTYCDVCNLPIYRRPSELAKSHTKTCSHSCNRKLYSKQISDRVKKNNPLPVMYGENNPAWKGGVTMFKKKGNYKNVRYVRCPQDFSGMARKDGYVMEHRLVIAKHINRLLTRKEVVHHIDHNHNNNKLKNLLLFPCNSSHKKYEGFELKGVMGIINGLHNYLK